MAHRNEGNEPLHTIEDITRTVPKGYAEVIAVDDCSDRGRSVDLSTCPGVVSIILSKHEGLFEAKRRAIEMASSDRIIIIDAHMRFGSTNWIQRLARYIDLDPRSITCTACFGFNQTRSSEERNGQWQMPNAPRRSGSLYHGGNMIIRRLHQIADELPRLEIMEPKWQKRQQMETYEIPSVLGACYGLSRTWFLEIGGFGGMRTWGGQEICLSLKTWLAGGRCQIDPNIEVGHLFRANAPNPHPPDDLWMNRMRIAEVCLPREAADFVVEEIGAHHRAAMKLFKRDRTRIVAERQEFQLHVRKNALDELLTRFPQIGWDAVRNGMRCGTALSALGR